MNVISSIYLPIYVVAEVLRTLIDIYKEVFKVPSLTDAILLQNYPTTILVIDEVLKQVR